MYNVLIAEDSKPILRNIKGLLESSGLPVRVAATAATGEEALDAFGRHAIDILLTDIRMPKMDGLTLIERAKRLHPKLKAVLISGYNDFEYARKAINLQVTDYLLKPVERSQLLEVMERILAQLREAQEDLASAFQGIVEERRCRSLNPGPEFFRNPKVVFIIREQPFTAGLDRPDEAYAAVCADLPSPAWSMPTVNGERLLVADASWLDPADDRSALLENVRLRLAAAGIQASLIGCLSPTEWNRIPEGYAEAARCLEEWQTVFKPVALDFALQRHYPHPGFEDVNRIGGVLASLIEQMNKDRFMLMLSEQLVKWERANVRLAELKRFFGKLAASFAALLEEGEEAGSAWLFGKREELFRQPSYKQFGSELLVWAEQCFDRAKSLNRKSGAELFERMDGYLRTNLYANVSIPDLVRLFHVSSSYISRIIKRFSGQTFVHYYTEMKINEARKLLETRPEMKIRDISDALCFADQHYFSKVFKEHVGVSPLEYKQRGIKRGERG